MKTSSLLVHMQKTMLHLVILNLFVTAVHHDEAKCAVRRAPTS